MGEEKLVLFKPDNIWSQIFINPNNRLGDEKAVIFHRLIGINGSEDEYIENIYRLMDKLKEDGTFLFFENGLTMDIDNKLVNDINVFWTTVTKLKNPSSKQIIDLTFRYLKPPFINEVIDKKVKSCLELMVETFRKKQSNLEILKNFYIKFVYWIEFYIPQLIVDGNKDHSKVLYWGDIKRDEGYFLTFLSWLGIDVLYINTKDSSGFPLVENIDNYSTLEVFNETKHYEKFPKRPKLKRMETVAFKASKEIHELLNSDDTGIYKPWQFEDYKVEVVPLKTTYEEMLILWKEPAKLRSGFSVKDGVVRVPSMFAKVSGVPEFTETYWVDVEELRDVENTVFLEGVPFTKDVIYHNQNILLKDGKFEASDVKNLREYKFTHLRASIQDLILERINDLIELEDFFLFNTSKMDFKYKVLHTILNLDNCFVNQLQKFDYSDQIPKLVIFDGDEKVCSEFDAIILGFLHLVGFDLVILTPTGYQNIEHLINIKYIDTHKRERFEMGLTVPKVTVHRQNKQKDSKKSWFEKIFNRS